MANTGFIQFASGGLQCTLQVRHVGSGNYVNWPCRDVAAGTQYAAGDTITSSAQKTIEFDARGTDSVQLTQVVGTGNFHVGTSAAPPNPVLSATVAGTLAATQSGTWTVQQGGAPWSVTVSGTVAQAQKTILNVSGLLTSDTDLVAAVASKRIKVLSYTLVCSGNTGVTAVFKSNGTGGTELWRVPLKAADSSSLFGANLSTRSPDWLFATAAGEKLTLDVDSAAPIHYSLSYHADDAS